MKLYELKQIIKEEITKVLNEDFINEEFSAKSKEKLTTQIESANIAALAQIAWRANQSDTPRKRTYDLEFQLKLPPNLVNWFDILRKIDEILVKNAGKTGSSFCENFSKARLKLNPQSVRFFEKEFTIWNDHYKVESKYLEILRKRMEKQKLDDVQRASESVNKFMIRLESDTKLRDIDKRLEYLEKAGAESRKIDIQKQNKLMYLGDQFLKLNKSQMPEPERGNFSGDYGYFLTYFNTSIYEQLRKVSYYGSSDQYDYVDMNILDPVQVGHFLALKSGFETMPKSKN